MKSYSDAGYGGENTNARRSTRLASSINMEPKLFGRIIRHESIDYEDDNVPIMHGDRWRRRGRLEGERLDRCRLRLVDKIQGHTL
jgi:hypothetical protein